MSVLSCFFQILRIPKEDGGVTAIAFQRSFTVVH